MTDRRELADRLEGCITASGGIDLRDPEVLREAARLLREPVAGELETALTDPNVVHINMLRGGIAKPTPERISRAIAAADGVTWDGKTVTLTDPPGARDDEPKIDGLEPG